MSTYEFSTLYTTLPHNLIKENLLDLIKRTFYKKEGKLYLDCNDKKAFFTSADHYRGYHLCSCQNVCDAFSFLLDNIYIRFGTKFWPIKNSGEVLSKLKDIGYQATSLSTYDFSTLYTTLPHNLIKEKLLDLIERTFYKQEGELYLACNDKNA